MKTHLRRHTVSCAICVVYLHDHIEVNWAHGVRSDITSASHAEGPGFESQCVHAYVHA